MEQVEGSHPQPGRRQSGEIRASCRHCNRGVGTTEIGLPPDAVARGVPEPETGVVQRRIDAAVVEHRVGEHLQYRSHLSAVARQKCQCRRQSAAGTGSADRDALGINPGQSCQPRQHAVTVLQRYRIRMLRCQPVVHRGHRDTQAFGVLPAHIVILGCGAEQVAPAVDPQQCRRRVRGVGRSVQSHARPRRQRQYVDPGVRGLAQIGQRPYQWQRPGADLEIRDQPRRAT